MEPYAWLINRSLAATQTTDPVLRARAASEAREMERVNDTHSQRVFIAPCSAEDPVGPAALLRLARPEREDGAGARPVMAREVGA